MGMGGGGEPVVVVVIQLVDKGGAAVGAIEAEAGSDSDRGGVMGEADDDADDKDNEFPGSMSCGGFISSLIGGGGGGGGNAMSSLAAFCTRRVSSAAATALVTDEDGGEEGGESGPRWRPSRRWRCSWCSWSRAEEKGIPPTPLYWPGGWSNATPFVLFCEELLVTRGLPFGEEETPRGAV